MTTEPVSSGRFISRRSSGFAISGLDLEPLVDETAYDDIVAPTELQISLTNGLRNADTARLDIQWSELGMYSFHYVDSDGVNW